MDFLVPAVAVFTLVFFAVQAGMALRFVAAIRSRRAALLTDERCPPAVVILCLRGRDPFLEDCLEGILSQDYPRYELRIVIDRETDPALAVVRECCGRQRAEGIRVDWRILSLPGETCSLKCSALIDGLEPLDADSEVVALCDADVIPHPTWLRELATALEPAEVGAATGYRWYVPECGTLGALTRYLWSAFAVVQMHCFRIPWGGSLALKRSFIRAANLPKHWSRAFCEDTMVLGQLEEQGQQLAFVSGAVMTNREDCDLNGLGAWIQRQLLTVRLYHPWWKGVLVHGILTTALPMILGGGLIVAMAGSNGTAAAALLGMAITYGMAMGIVLIAMESSVRRIARCRGEAIRWLTISSFLRFLISLPLLQGLYPRALAAAVRMREIQWRGISYAINGPWSIRRKGYQPCPADPEKADQSL